MLKPRTVLSFLVKFSWAAALSTAGETLAESSKQDSSEVLHIAAFGDSITRAFNANGPVDHPWNSWATGNSDEVGLFRRGHVKSHAELLSELTGKQVYVHNVAKSGAKSDDLARQVDAVKNIPVHYATMLIGANDLCANGKPIGDGIQADMSKFGGRVESAIQKLIAHHPDVKILLVSIPDMPRLQRIGSGTSCQARWTAFGICKNLLRDGISSEELSLFERQWQSANEDLESIASRHPTNVLYNPRLAEYPFERKLLSDMDCFHPNIAGQNLLSSETWSTGWWGN